MDKKQKERARRVFKAYGLTLDVYDSVVAKGCFICGMSKEQGRINMDHVHVRGYKAMSPEEKKKYVRAGLCFLCNTGIKGLEKTSDGKRNRKMLEGMVKYFAIYPLKGEI